MKKTLKKILITSMIVGGVALTTIPVATLITSCVRNSESNPIITQNKVYVEKETENLTNTYSFPKYVKSSSNTKEIKDSSTIEIQPSIQNLYDNAKAAKTQLETINKESLNQNEVIWLESYITQWDIKIKNIETGLIYLGANPITGSVILSSRKNSIANNIKDAINIYDLNPETGDPDPTKPNIDLIKNINFKIDDAITFIQSMHGYLSDGMNLKIMPSNLTKKSFIKQTLEFFYQDLISSKLNNSTANIKVGDLFNKPISYEDAIKITNPYFNNFLTRYNELAKKNNISNSEISNKLGLLSNTLDNFMNFYTTTYYTAAGSYGGNTNELILSKNNGTTNQQANNVDNKEVEETLTIYDQNTKKEINVYGVGYSDQDLKTKNVGIGFMTPLQTVKNIVGVPYNGNSMYEQMLYNNNSINKKAQEIYSTGIQLTKSATKNMKSIAKLVINEIYKENDVTKFNPEIWHTTDPYKWPAQGQTLDSIYDDIINNKTYYATVSEEDKMFAKFNIWLNQEDFFFGREKIRDKVTDEVPIVDKYWKNADINPKLKQYKEIVTKQGYTKNWENLENINGSLYTVSGINALAGAVASMEAYTTFKESTDQLFQSNFNQISDYVLSPYEFSVRKDVGVGLEGPRGSKQFQYNVDPYYSLQRWSVASLTTHEGAMGHHTQQQYWTEYMPGTKDGVVDNNNITPGYSFKNVAFHEGWAVFAEWFAVELGTYGTWGDNVKFDGNKLPTNWLKNSTKILNIVNEKEPTKEEIEFIKNFQASVYWDIVSTIPNNDSTSNNPSLYTNEKEIAVAATKLANMLSYYGYLNEAQLRNMRLALDTAVHYKGGSNTSGEIQFGASIHDQREWMKKNSGLGQGDISSESIRYMSMPSQATGYMLGKIVINNLYSEVKAKYTKENATNTDYDFVKDGRQQIKELFDLILRNGEIPLNVVQDSVSKQFQLKTIVKK